MKTNIKIDKNAKYILLFEEYGTYEVVTGEKLIKEIESFDITSKDKIFKLGEEYRLETTLIKVEKTNNKN